MHAHDETNQEKRENIPAPAIGLPQAFSCGKQGFAFAKTEEVILSIRREILLSSSNDSFNR
jgi:hypothetical protein